MNIAAAKSMLTAMEAMKLQANSGSNAVATKQEAGFADILKQQVEHINTAHQNVDKLQERFVLGEDVSLAEIKTAELKASIYTQSLIQVRNELMKAYHEVMNMTI